MPNSRLIPGRLYAIRRPEHLAGRTVGCDGEGDLFDPITARAVELPALFRLRPDWFSVDPTAFNAQLPEPPTVKELVHAAVTAWPDSTRVMLRERLLGCNPRSKGFTLDTLSDALSDDPRITMWKDGVQVTKLGHNQRCCTFRPHSSANLTTTVVS